jgi:hypothetical protein
MARVKAGTAPEGQVCADDASKTKTIEVHILSACHFKFLWSVEQVIKMKREGKAEGREPGRLVLCMLPLPPPLLMHRSCFLSADIDH